MHLLKFFLCFLFTIAGVFSFAQTTGTFTFRFLDESDTLFFTIYATPEKMTLDGSIEKGFHERIVVDFKNKKILELIDDHKSQEAYYTTWKYNVKKEALLITSISELLLITMPSRKSYKVLPDKKLINGIPCQKFVFIDEETGDIRSEGWFARGLHIKVSYSIAFIELKEGVVVSLQNFEDEKFTIDLVEYKKTIDDPEAAFSMEVPEEYELIDLDDDIKQ